MKKPHILTRKKLIVGTRTTEPIHQTKGWIISIRLARTSNSLGYTMKQNGFKTG